MGTSLPLISSIATYFTGTVAEEFRKLFKPASLVLASLFLILNLVLILPTLAEAGVAPVVALQSFSTAWQLALGLVALLTLGYLFNSLGGFFIRCATGEVFQDTILEKLLLHFQRLAYDAQVAIVEEFFRSPAGAGKGTRSEQVMDATRALNVLAYEFPNRKYLTLTRLGNILAHAANYTFNQYGCDQESLWPAMEHILEKENPELRQRIEQNNDSLVFLASLTVLLNLVALEFVIIQVILTSPWNALWAVGLLALAYIVYAASLQKARSWSKDVRTAFDLYTPKLEECLQLRPIKGFGAEKARKERFQEISWWLAFGGTEFPPILDDVEKLKARPNPEWYAEKPAPQSDLTIISPPSVSVIPQVCEIDWEPKSKRRKWKHVKKVEYLFVVTNPSSGECARVATNVFLLISDHRFPIVPGNKTGDVYIEGSWRRIKGECQRSKFGKPEALLWHLPDIQVNQSVLLKYSLCDTKMRIECASEDVAIEDQPTFKNGKLSFFVKSTANCPVETLVTLSIMGSCLMLDKNEVHYEDRSPQKADQSSDKDNLIYSWTIKNIRDGQNLSVEVGLVSRNKGPDR